MRSWSGPCACHTKRTMRSTRCQFSQQGCLHAVNIHQVILQNCIKPCSFRARGFRQKQLDHSGALSGTWSSEHPCSQHEILHTGLHVCTQYCMSAAYARTCLVCLNT